jgi:hypothetical protein
MPAPRSRRANARGHVFKRCDAGRASLCAGQRPCTYTLTLGHPVADAQARPYHSLKPVLHWLINYPHPP